MSQPPAADKTPATPPTTTGDMVNIAARLEQSAPAGEILLGESTYRVDRTINGDWAADFYVDTPGTTGSFSPPIPVC